MDLNRTNSFGEMSMEFLFGKRNGGRLPPKSKSCPVTANKEFNIFGCEGLVSTSYILEKTEHVKNEVDIVSVEYEDLLDRQEGDSVFRGIGDLLANDQDRQWTSVKFTDSINFTQMEDYERYQTTRKSLWTCIENPVQEKKIPVKFNTNVEFSSGHDTPSLVLDLLAALRENDGEQQELSLERINFGGAIRFCRTPKAFAAALLERCRGKHDNDPHEVICLKLLYKAQPKRSEGARCLPSLCVDKFHAALVEAMATPLVETGAQEQRDDKSPSDIARVHRSRSPKRRAPIKQKSLPVHRSYYLSNAELETSMDLSNIGSFQESRRRLRRSKSTDGESPAYHGSASFSRLRRNPSKDRQALDWNASFSGLQRNKTPAETPASEGSSSSLTTIRSVLGHKNKCRAMLLQSGAGDLIPSRQKSPNRKRSPQRISSFRSSVLKGAAKPDFDWSTSSLTAHASDLSLPDFNWEEYVPGSSSSE